MTRAETEHAEQFDGLIRKEPRHYIRRVARMAQRRGQVDRLPRRIDLGPVFVQQFVKARSAIPRAADISAIVGIGSSRDGSDACICRVDDSGC